MPTIEGFRLKVLKYRRILFADRRNKALKNKEFTIISNNCWGGMVYESYNLPKQSPTVGMFFMAQDYIKFILKLEQYIAADLTFIKPELSRWKDKPEIFKDKRFGSYPIGVLTLNSGESIELFFLHYHNEHDAREKWERRCKRINKDKLLVKFNDQNGCTEKEIDEFINSPIKNKIFFTARRWDKEDAWRKKLTGYYRAHQLSKNKFIMASYEPFGNHMGISITEILNSL